MVVAKKRHSLYASNVIPALCEAPLPDAHRQQVLAVFQRGHRYECEFLMEYPNQLVTSSVNLLRSRILTDTPCATIIRELIARKTFEKGTEINRIRHPKNVLKNSSNLLRANRLQHALQLKRPLSITISDTRRLSYLWRSS